MEVRDLILQPPDATPYNKLKEQLIKHTAASEQCRLQQLFNAEELGDRKPVDITPMTNATAPRRESNQHRCSIYERTVPTMLTIECTHGSCFHSRYWKSRRLGITR